MSGKQPTGDCRRVRPLLALHVSDDLDSSEQIVVTRHLGGCRDCTAYLESLRESHRVLETIRMLGQEKPAQPTLWPEIERQLPAAPRPRVRPAAWRVSTWHLGSIAAGLLVAVFLTDGSEWLRRDLPRTRVQGNVGDAVPIDHSLFGPLGINTQDMDAGLARRIGLPSGRGVIVVDVWTKAAARHVQPLDVILAVDGVAVTDKASLIRLSQAHPAGSPIRLDLWRDGRVIQREIRLDTAPRPQADDDLRVRGTHAWWTDDTV